MGVVGAERKTANITARLTAVMRTQPCLLQACVWCGGQLEITNRFLCECVFYIITPEHHDVTMVKCHSDQVELSEANAPGRVSQDNVVPRERLDNE